MKVQPILFAPTTKSYLWGGTKLKEKWGKASSEATIAECWELSAYQGSESVAVGGDFDGQTLGEIVSTHPTFFGAAVGEGGFPILVKLIDAAKDLSIQVHPDDLYARVHEGDNGKTEMWYIAEAAPDAAIYYGFARDVSREEVEKSIRENTVTALLRRVPVTAGDAFLVPAGTVHALLAGVTVIEIQESSNVTYRVYDYDRRDQDGNPRQLHIEKALEVMQFCPREVAERWGQADVADGVTERKLACCNYFRTSEICIRDGAYEIAPQDTFVTFTVSGGEGYFAEGGRRIRKGETWLVPNGCRAKIQGKGLTLVTTVV